MPISDGEWVSIRSMIESIVGKKGEYFTTGAVIKRDDDNKLVWLAEFGDQPIPLVAFDYKVKYYGSDTAVDFVTQTATSTVKPNFTTAEVVTPQVGEVVIVAREFGVNRLPRCLGVLKGKNWIDSTEG